MNNSWNDKKIIDNLLCPSCGGFLVVKDASIYISCDGCAKTYPIVSGIPVMIDDEKSVFTQADFTGNNNLFFDLTPAGKFRSFISLLLPSMVTPRSSKHFKYLEKILLKDNSNSRPRVLILGGSVLGGGMKKFVNNTNIDFIHSDVSFGPQTEIILDAHVISYKDASFDLVIAQAVLEHVIDPKQCVAEIWRVLKPGGLIFADTPFMQQVHGGAYDFTRFTHGGQRKLFARFTEIQSGASSGAGSVMAWSYQYLLLGLFGYNKILRYVVKAFARLTGFWLKYFDYLEVQNPYHIDGASSIYFIGKKSEKVKSDRDIVNEYGNKGNLFKY